MGKTQDRESADAGSAGQRANREELDRLDLGYSRARSQAYRKIAEYLQALSTFAKPLMDYASDKCFAADVIFELENEQISRIQNETRDKIENSIHTMTQVLVTAKGDLDRAASLLTGNRQDERFHAALERMVEHRLEEKTVSEARFKKAVVLVILISTVIVIGLVWIVLKQL